MSDLPRSTKTAATLKAAPPGGRGTSWQSWPARALFILGALGVVVLTAAAIKMSRPVRPNELRRPVASARGIGNPNGNPAANLNFGRRETFPEVESRIFQVAEATGRVEANRKGRWVLVSRGDVLTQDDLVRTTNGRALLKFGVGTEVELRDRVEVRLESISRAGASLDLRRGKVVARVGRADSNIVITAANTRTVNDRSAPARFVVLADTRGQVTVAATEGAARFEAAGQAVVVPAGKVTRAKPGQAPADPETIPEEIFLTVTWPTREPREEGRVAVGGRVDARSLVRINGVVTEHDPNGRFAASVPVEEGVNPVEVEVEDISGRIRVERRDIRKVPTRPPDLEPLKTELWNR